MDPVRRVAAVLQDAVVGNAPVGAFVESVARLIGADRGLLICTQTTASGEPEPFAAFNFPAEALHEYRTRFAGHDAYLRQLAAQKRLKRVTTGADLWDRATYLRTEVFNDFYRYYDVYWGCGLSGARRDARGYPLVQLSFARGDAHGPFGQPETGRLWELLPHFDAGMRLLEQHRQGCHATLAAVFENAADAIAVLNSDGAVRYANARFDALRAALCTPWTRYWRRPLEAPGLGGIKAAFDKALLQARHGGAAAVRFNCLPTPVDLQGRYAGTIFSVLVCGGFRGRPGEHYFVVALHERDATESERIAVFRARYRLTPAETRVLKALAEGLSVPAIADKFRVSAHTIRTQVKAMLAKTGCHRQSALLHLLAETATGQLRLSL